MTAANRNEYGPHHIEGFEDDHEAKWQKAIRR